MSLAEVRRIADAILYEGYILYPYRASAQKNQSRWQFGVLMPPCYAAVDPSENSTMRAECVFEHYGQPTVDVTVRFLQVQRRRTAGAAPDGSRPDTGVLDASVPAVWDEAVEQEVTVAVSSQPLLGDGTDIQFTVPGGEDTETMAGARVVRRREPLTGSVSVRATPLPGPWQAARLTVQVTNESDWSAHGEPPPPERVIGDRSNTGANAARSPAGESPPPEGVIGDPSNTGANAARSAAGGAPPRRETALPAALVAAHVIITVSGGAFLSMTDPPEWASQEVAACQNTGCWPVLAGPEGGREVMLAAPIILPDHPQIASESPGELYDGTEIDEILTLRTLALSAEEKAAARATDPRAAALIDRVDAIDAPTMAQLHGTIRAMSTHRPAGPESGGDHVPWWDPGADASVSPGTDSVVVAGHRVARGSRVILRPGTRRADAQDMFLAGRAALVEAVLLDVDDTAYLAVTLADDPAADLHSAHGRFLYFAPDEVEPDAGDTGGRVQRGDQSGRCRPMTGRTLVAGVGNIFQRDDAFGVEVIRLLAGRPRPPGVKIADFGIRGVHLVYELLDGCDLFVLVDVAQRGCAPGTVTVIEVEPADMASPSGVMDAHGLAPDQVFAMLASMGSRPGRSLVVACEPADVSAGMGLSDTVREALPHAVRAVEKILEQVEQEVQMQPEKGADTDVHAD
jgi:hydrogenase maturation protease